jgi:hypothetical protein
MKTVLLIASGILAYALIRDVIPKAFVMRIAYVTAAELRG